MRLSKRGSWGEPPVDRQSPLGGQSAKPLTEGKNMSAQGELRAKFHAMTEGTAEDWQKIATAAVAFNRELPDRVLAHLKLLEGDCGGFPVDRMEHSLQSATLAHRDGMEEEYVVCALLHDIGDTLASYNHAELGATILKPFVSEENHWMLQNHGIF